MATASRSIILVLIGAALGYAIQYWPGSNAATRTDRADGPLGSDQNLPTTDIVSLGRLLPKNGIIGISAPPGERLAELRAREGDVVAKGDVLGTLSSLEARLAQLEVLRAKLVAAETGRQAALAGAKAQLQQADAAVEQAKLQQQLVQMADEETQLLRSRVGQARKELERLQRLRNQDRELVKQQAIERQALVLQSAEAELAQAKRANESAMAKAALAVRAAEADRVAAEAALQQHESTANEDAIRRQIESAQIEANWSKLQSPISGTVLRTLLEPGEFVAASPILQVASLGEIICVAEVYETEIKKLSIGDKATLTSEALAPPFHESGLTGTVARIGRVVAAPNISSRNPLQAGERHVVDVEVAVDMPDDAAAREAARLLNLEVMVRFKLGQD